MEISNETLFWLLAAVGMVIALGIYFISRAIGHLVSSKGFKQRLAKIKSEKALRTLLILVTTGISVFAEAATIQTEGTSSILGAVTKNMLWSILAIDMVLLIIFVYVRSHFRGLVKLVYPEVIEHELARKKKRSTRVLTDIVPIEEEYKILLDHDYDGIQELDNNLPPWWKYGFYLSIIVAVMYMFNYHVFKLSDLQVAEYEASVLKAEKEVQAYLASKALNVDENSVTTMTATADLNKGKQTFETLCAACHLKDGGGSVGPNLTDDYWLYGPDIKSIFKTIKYGAKNGMKSWQDELNPVEIQQVASYIRTLHGTSPAVGKAPQGALMPWEPEIEVTAEDSLVALLR